LFWILQDAGMEEGIEYDLDNLNAARQEVCKGSNVQLLAANNKPFLCLSVTYVYAAMKFGWKIDAQKFKIFQKINDVQVSWTFGVAATV
jgi:hypothetical protein